MDGLEVLFSFDGEPEGLSLRSDLRIISVLDLPGWAPSHPSFLARHKTVRTRASGVVGWLFQSYFRYRWARKVVDGTGLVHTFWNTPYFRLPKESEQRALLDALGERHYPRVESGAPVLVELWQQDGSWQLHLVNYASRAQNVRVDFGRTASGRVFSPDRSPGGGGTGGGEAFRGSEHGLLLDVYAVAVFD
jgi:hypothetical protein